MNSFNQLLMNAYFLAYIGALMGHVLSLYASNFKGSVPFFKSMLPGRTPVFYTRLDFIILPVIGAFIANVLMDPMGPGLRPPIFAGLSWSASLSALIKKQSKV